MREPAFLRQNKDKWLEYERTLFGEENRTIDPDRLAELYIQLTDDLAYARTFYPKSQTVRYLNGLAARTHLAIYKNKKENRSRLFTFWTRELPLIYYSAHRFMLYATIAFTFSFLIGMFSALMEESYITEIMGQHYVNMTQENISNGDPTAVYKGSPSFPMFLRIALNNTFIAFVIFASGILFSVGSIFGIPGFIGGIFQNGVMIGTFLTMFFIKEVALEAIPIIYIHGTLEISAIIIAGGAGMMLGHSILFPGTHTRTYSMMQGAKAGIKIMVGLVPVFLMAAFLESYVTRLSDMPVIINLLIIALSAAFIIWYYVLYPITLFRKLTYEREKI